MKMSSRVSTISPRGIGPPGESTNSESPLCEYGRIVVCSLHVPRVREGNVPNCV